MADTGDGLSLPIGEGGVGLGVTRDTGSGADAVVERIPRNAPHIFNLGAKEFRVLFHDGRVALDPRHHSGFISPAGDDLPLGLENVVAVQAMFPVTSAAEMAGQQGENPIADAVAAGNWAGPGGVWEQLAWRLQAIPEYVDLFIEAFDDIESVADITFVHAANAISAFERTAWRADDSPFDRYLLGDKHAMNDNEVEGMRLFYRSNNRGVSCASCHSGVFQTDHEFHAIGMPQIGPGKGDDHDGRSDYGRERVTGGISDRYKFRTPSLRNAALTAPYGHDGAFNTLRGVIEHHIDPVASLLNYDRDQVVMPSRSDLDTLDFIVMDDLSRVSDIATANELGPMHYNNREIDRLIDYLHALTDPNSIDLRHDVPKSVPSGLPLAE